MRQKLLFSILSLLGLPLSMMAQTITPERKTVALGEEFKVSYTDAPADALLVVWKTGTNKNEPTVQTTISAGSGEATLAIPSDATLDPYWIQMVTNGDEGFVDLSNRATIATNYTNEDMLLIALFGFSYMLFY